MDDTSLEIMKILMEIKEEVGSIKSDVKATYDQACKTNGRVNKIETVVIPALDDRINDIEDNQSNAEGKKTVWVQIAKFGGSIGSILLAAAAGAWFGRIK